MTFEKTLPDNALIEEDKDFTKFLKIVSVVVVFAIGSFMCGMAVANLLRPAVC